MNKHRLIGFLLMACSISSALADDTFKVKFRSRALVDGTLTRYQVDKPQGYYRLEDFRAGFKATYKNITMKTEVGIRESKVTIKDLIVNFKSGNSTWALGNAYEPFASDMLISTVDLRFHQSAASVLAIGDSRKLGLTYHYSNGHVYVGTGVYLNFDINHLADPNHKNAGISTSRFVWYLQDGYNVWHVGGDFSYRTPMANLKAPYVEHMGTVGVTALLPSPLLDATVDGLSHELKGAVEFGVSSRKWLFQGEYLHKGSWYTEEGGGIYQPHGGYLQAAYLLKGEGFNYDADYAIFGRPSTERAIELAIRWNYTQMNGNQVKGGEEMDLSVGANFYLNKYMAIKVNGSYVWVGKHCPTYYNKNLLLFQTRLQYIF